MTRTLARRAWVLSLPDERLPRGAVGGLVVDAQSVARSAVSPTGRSDSSARLRRSASLARGGVDVDGDGQQRQLIGFQSYKEFAER